MGFLVVALCALGAYALHGAAHPAATTKTAPSISIDLAAMVTPDSATIIARCDHGAPGTSLGLPAPTLVGREDDDVAVIFVSQDRYGFCVLSGKKDSADAGPVTFKSDSKPVTELDAMGTELKVSGR
jgi:hypothetical protein